MLGFFSIGYLSIGKGNYKRNISVWAYTYLLLFLFSIVAQAINYLVPTILGVDNCMSVNTNMWYISMFYNSTVFFIKDIWNLSPGINGYGWILAYVLYLIGLGLADFIVINIYYGTYKLFARLRYRRKAKKLMMNK